MVMHPLLTEVTNMDSLIKVDDSDDSTSVEITTINYQYGYINVITVSFPILT